MIFSKQHHTYTFQPSHLHPHPQQLESPDFSHLRMTFVRDIKSTWQKVSKVMGIPIDGEGDVAPSGSAGSEG